MPDTDAETTASGIIIPEGADRPKCKSATVINVGENVSEAIKKQVGKKVVVFANHGAEVDYDKKTYRILRDSDILALIVK